MNIFYAHNIIGTTVRLSQEDSKHCVKVLRKKVGDSVRVTDGVGHWYDCQVELPDPKNCILKIIKEKFTPIAYAVIHVAIAPTKSPQRFDWFLEKATELGIHSITPLICDHSERKSIKKERAERVIISAMKQSLKAWKPVLNPESNFENFMNTQFEGYKFIAHKSSSNSFLQDEILNTGEVTILIGPEGDFSPNELKAAFEQGFRPVSLGLSRLRTETAGIAALQIIHTVRNMV